MICKNCGKSVDENAKFCIYCGSDLTSQAGEAKENNSVDPATEAIIAASNNSDKKVWKILSYIGILFIVGMLCKDKNDKSVRFHVGQGILAFIADVVVTLIVNLVVYKVFRTPVTVWGIPTGAYRISSLGYLISYVLYAIPFVLSILGIVNAVKNEDKELPVIGKLAFYK